MAEDLSMGVRMAITMMVFVAVIFVVLNVFKITKGFDRQFQLQAGAGIAQSAKSDFIDISNKLEPVCGATVYSTVAKNIYSIDEFKIVWKDGTKSYNVEDLKNHMNTTFMCSYEGYNVTVTEVGDMYED